MARATHFWPSRSTPRPGTARIVASTNASPGPVAIAAGITTAAAARISSGTAARVRTNTGSPIATMPTSVTVAIRAKTVVRVVGTASPFQIPPRPARLPRVARPGSARAANAWTPAADVGDDTESPTAAATSHGAAASTDVPQISAATRRRRQPSPGAATHTSATVAASIRPVGVSPARAVQNSKPHIAAGSDALRSRSTQVATHGRQPYPNSRLQCPCNNRSATYGFQIASVAERN